MILSLSEIEQTLRRAALGTGWPYGLAEEAGRAAGWAAAQGLDGVGAALAALAPGPAEAAVERAPDGWRFPAARVAVAGPSAFDLVAAGAGRAELIRADAPLFLIGFAGVAAGAYRRRFALGFADGGRAVVSAGGVALEGALPRPGTDVVITAEAGTAETGSAGPAPAPGAGVTVDDARWARALELAARSYVPSSEASHLSGAGAGLTDND